MEKRIIGLDLLRIFSMFGIIGLHIINQGGIINNLKINSINYYIVLFLLIIFYTSVDIFGLLSGYLNINKKNNKNSRIIELIIITLFYSMCIFSIFYIFNLCDVRKLGYKELIFNIFPILKGRYWYITCYVFLFFVIPYINMLCNYMSKDNYKKLLIILFILFTIIPNIFGMNDFFHINNGYSPFWLIYCYIVGGYIKLYDIKLDIKKIIKYILILLFSTLIINSLIRIIGYSFLHKVVKGDWFINYISPLTLSTSILLLLLFKNININNKLNKVIIYLSGASFAVYIIHCHKLIYDYVLINLYKPFIEYNPILVFLIIIGSIFLVYITCSIIDFLRKKIFNIFRINRLINYIGLKMDKVINIKLEDKYE